MKVFLRSVILILSLVLMISSFIACNLSSNNSNIQVTTSSAYNTEVFSKYVVTAVEVNVRDKPSTDSDSNVLDTYYKNTTLLATPTVDKEWNKIKLDDEKIAYVYAEYVSEISDDRYEMYKNYQLKDKKAIYGAITSDFSSLMSLPNTESSDIVAVFRKNDTIECVGITKNNWYVTSYNDILCYIPCDEMRELSKSEYDAYNETPSKKDSADNFTLIGSYATDYSSSNSNRNYNVEKSAGEIDGMVIKPGAMFNWCRDMGPCGEYEGYKESNEIVNGEYVKGYGGGICQLSSTLCAAIIKSDGDFEFIERNKHSIAQAYIPNELDATVSFPDCNFVFKNDNSFSIMIKTSCVEYNLEVYIYKVN